MYIVSSKTINPHSIWNAVRVLFSQVQPAVRKKTDYFCHCSQLALSLDKVGCASEEKIKTFFIFSSLSLHYLCKKNFINVADWSNSFL